MGNQMKFLLVIMASGIARARTHDDDGIAQDGGHSAAYRETEKYSLGLWSIDTCQNRVSADQYHVIISQAHA